MRKMPSSTRPGDVFTVAEARDEGWTRSAVECGVRAGRITRLRRGVYRPATAGGELVREDALRVRTAAAVAACRVAVASHGAAAALAGLPVWSAWSRPCLTVAPRFSGDLDGVHLHRARLPKSHVVHESVRRTSVARTVVDLAREHGLTDAVVACDAALARGAVTETELIRTLGVCAGWPGVRRARRVLELADGLAESPLESASRLRLSGAGLPTPELQRCLRSLTGYWLGRVDFYWDEFGVVGEVDGMIKYSREPGDVDPLVAEKRRQELLERAGLIVVRWMASDLRDMPVLASRLRRAFAQGAARTGPRGWVVGAPPALPLAYMR